MGRAVGTFGQEEECILASSVQKPPEGKGVLEDLSVKWGIILKANVKYMGWDVVDLISVVSGWGGQVARYFLNTGIEALDSLK